ncbi:hypothetical protein ABPG75_000194 [Micractinium tetrahymenae]
MSHQQERDPLDPRWAEEWASKIAHQDLIHRVDCAFDKAGHRISSYSPNWVKYTDFRQLMAADIKREVLPMMLGMLPPAAQTVGAASAVESILQDCLSYQIPGTQTPGGQQAGMYSSVLTAVWQLHMGLRDMAMLGHGEQRLPAVQRRMRLYIARAAEHEQKFLSGLCCVAFSSRALGSVTGANLSGLVEQVLPNSMAAERLQAEVFDPVENSAIDVVALEARCPGFQPCSEVLSTAGASRLPERMKEALFRFSMGEHDALELMAELIAPGHYSIQELSTLQRESVIHWQALLEEGQRLLAFYKRRALTLFGGHVTASTFVSMQFILRDMPMSSELAALSQMLAQPQWVQAAGNSIVLLRDCITKLDPGYQLEKADAVLSSIAAYIGNMGERLEELGADVEQLKAAVAALEARQDRMESRQDESDARMAKLVAEVKVLREALAFSMEQRGQAVPAELRPYVKEGENEALPCTISLEAEPSLAAYASHGSSSSGSEAAPLSPEALQEARRALQEARRQLFVKHTGTGAAQEARSTPASALPSLGPATPPAAREFCYGTILPPHLLRSMAGMSLAEKPELASARQHLTGASG